MKKLALITLMLIFSGLSTATIATYTGETVKEGPEATFMMGVASDQELNLEVEVEETKGLNFSYSSSLRFDPDDSEKFVQRAGKEYSLKEIKIGVSSGNVSKERYDIPVTLRAFNNQSSEGTRPQVIHERDYTFVFVTDLSSEYGIDGELISTEKEQEEDEPDETLNITEDKENTLTEQNQTEVQGEENQSGPGRTTFLLIGGIIILTLYIVREAFT